MAQFKAIFLAGMVIGCGTEKGAGVRVPGVGDGSSAPNNPTALIGTWVASCFKLDASSYAKKTAIFTKDTYLLKTETFSDLSPPYCEIPAKTTTDGGSYRVKGSSPFGSFSQFKVDLTLTKKTTSFETFGMVTAANAEQLCGKSDWNRGEEVSILGLTCGEETYTAGAVTYTRIQSNLSRLFWAKFDDKLDGSSDEKRGNDIDITAVFYKE